jgi:hypothetical protein
VIPRPISKLSGRWVTYVPFDPSLETPDEGGTNERLTWIHSVRESRPSRVQPAVSNPAQSKAVAQAAALVFARRR